MSYFADGDGLILAEWRYRGKLQCMQKLSSEHRAIYLPWHLHTTQAPSPNAEPTPPTSNPSHVKLSQVGYTHPYSQHTVNLSLLLKR